MEELHRAIADADRSLLGRDAPTSQDLHDMMQELTRTARSVRVFVDYLQQHPEVLIRGKKEQQSMTPRIAAIAAACALAALSAGCASPPSHLYTLSPRVRRQPPNADEADSKLLCRRRTGVDTRHRRPPADRGAHECESGHGGRVQSLGIAVGEQYFARGRRQSRRHCSGRHR